MFRGKANGVRNESVLIFFYHSHLLCLLLDAHIAMDDSNATLECHVDGHVVLSDSVHGRADERGLQLDVTGNIGRQINIVRCEANVGRH